MDFGPQQKKKQDMASSLARLGRIDESFVLVARIKRPWLMRVVFMLLKKDQNFSHRSSELSKSRKLKKKKEKNRSIISQICESELWILRLRGSYQLTVRLFHIPLYEEDFMRLYYFLLYFLLIFVVFYCCDGRRKDIYSKKSKAELMFGFMFGFMFKF